MKLNREGVQLNAEERNKRNQNWATLEVELDGIGEKIADSGDAKELAENVQAQVNALVVQGDSSVEARQARVDAKGVEAATLKARLDAEHNTVTAQLAETLKKGAGSVQPVDLSQSTKELLTGGSVAVVGVNTVLEENIVDKQVSPQKTTFFKNGKNLFNKNASQKGYTLNHTNGTVAAAVDKETSDFTPVLEGMPFTLSRIDRIAYYNANFDFISGEFVGGATPLTRTPPAGARWTMYSMPSTLGIPDSFMFVYGTTLGEYEEYRQYIADQTIESMPQLLSDIQKKVDFPTTKNILLNTDFSGSTWLLSNATNVSTVGGVKTFTPTASLGNINQLLSNLPDHVFYVSADVQSVGGDVRLQLVNASSGVPYNELAHNPNGEKTTLSFVTKVNAGNARFRAIEYGGTPYKNISFSNPLLVDLTELYGAGNEPTAAEFKELLMTHNNGSSFFSGELVVQEFISKTSAVSRKPVFVQRIGNTIKVVYKYNASQDAIVEWRLNGANGLFDFYRLSFVENASDNVSSSSAGTVAFTNTTDFLGPHVVLAKENIDGAYPTGFNYTGGNHLLGGVKTARASGSVKLRIEGREVAGDFVGYANSIEISWASRIQAYNTFKTDGTGREVIEQRFRMLFDGIKFNIYSEIEMLENTTYKANHGLQSLASGIWGGSVYYHTSANKKINDATVNGNSGSKKTNAITVKGTVHALDIEIDANEGLGSRQYLPEPYTNGAFVLNGKTYFNLMETTDFEAGDILTFKGAYRIYSVN